MRRALLAVALLAPFAAQAQETRLRLGESATVRRAPDEAHAALRAEGRAGTAAAAQAAVNRAMTTALEQAGRVPGLRATTGRFGATRGDDTRALWVASQVLSLRGSDVVALAELVGTLQAQGLAIDSMGAALSEPVRQEAREEATRLALRALRARAALVAEELGMTVSHLAEVTLDRDAEEPRMAMASAGYDSRAARPAVALAEVPVTARVSADVILLPR